MSAREEILVRLRLQARAAPMPPAWLSRRRFDDLALRFADSLRASKGECFRAGSLREAVEQLGAFLDEVGARRVVINDEPVLREAALPDRWPDREWHIVGQGAGDLRAFCATADVGISGAVAALAETGTVVIQSGVGRSRLATLLPPMHIALVPTTILTPDLFTWTAARGGALPAAMTLISGPSKSADIEQTLAVGVHGPKRFVVFLYDA